MLKKVIDYEDYNGTKRSEDHYFHMNKSEIIKWLTTSGDYTLDQMLMRIIKERNGKEIMSVFEDLIRISYGRKSVDGRRFEKNEEIWNDFYQTEAYSILFTELVTDAEKAVEFLNGILPKELSDEVEKAIKENPNGIPDELMDYAKPLLGKKK